MGSRVLTDCLRLCDDDESLSLEPPVKLLREKEAGKSEKRRGLSCFSLLLMSLLFLPKPKEGRRESLDMRGLLLSLGIGARMAVGGYRFSAGCCCLGGSCVVGACACGCGRLPKREPGFPNTLPRVVDRLCDLVS